jgi:hypothetical protein
MSRKNKNPLHLKDGDRVICAYAQPANGPRWWNAPLWVIVESRSGVIRMECLQPLEQGIAVLKLYHVAEALHRALLDGIAEATGEYVGQSDR